MRATPLLVIALIVTGSTLASALDFVRQTQVLNGNSVVTDQTVTSTTGQTTNGTVTSAAMTSSLSIFQLWASYTDANSVITMLKLDEKSLGTFLPTVTVTTASEDPYVPTRTRADKPYSVTVKVSGMLSDPTYPDYARRILLGRGYKEYSPVTFAPTGVVGTYSNSSVYYANGTFATTGIYQQLPGLSATDAAGAETFTASIQPEANSSNSQVADGEVVVWPVGSATITGIENGAKYLGMPQSGIVSLTNAYPKSTTYVQIYKGTESLGTVGVLIPNSTVEYSTTLPKSTTISSLDLESLSSQFPTDGQYTVEVLTVTPFNGGAPERLAYVTFEMHRTIALNAMVTTME